MHHNYTKHYGSGTLNNSPQSHLIMSYCFTVDYLYIYIYFLLEMEADQFGFICFTSQPDLHTKKQKQRKAAYFLLPKLTKTLWEE